MESDPVSAVPKKRPNSINLEEDPKISKLEPKQDVSDEEIEQETDKYPRIRGCRTVDSFQKLNRVEEGTYGVVYRAKDKDSGDIVALKRVKMDKHQEGFPITSLREIKLLMQKKHPNVVDVREIVVGETMDDIFIVMEFLEHDLRDLLTEMKDDTRFLSSEVKCLLQQLLQGVAFLHENWILHRDLKTSNLLLNNKGILKVADFGMAREYGSPLKSYTQMVITQWYRPPELLLGATTYSTAVDMWSVGCIFAELITKEPLFPGKTEIDQLVKIFDTIGTPNSDIWPELNDLPHTKKINIPNKPFNMLRKKFSFGITETCYDLMCKMLTYDPKKRISAVDALKHPYFSEHPKAKDPEFMPMFRSTHEGAPTKKRPEEEEQKQQMKKQNEDERFKSLRDRAYLNL